VPSAIVPVPWAVERHPGRAFTHGHQRQAVSDTRQIAEASGRHTLEIACWMSIGALRDQDDIVACEVIWPGRPRDRMPVARNWATALRPRDQVAIVIGSSRCVHDAQHWHSTSQESDGHGVSSESLLHRPGAIVRVNEPAVLFGVARLDVWVRFLAAISPCRERVRQLGADECLSFIIRVAVAGDPDWSAGLSTRRSQNGTRGDRTLSRNTER